MSHVPRVSPGDAGWWRGDAERGTTAGGGYTEQINSVNFGLNQHGHLRCPLRVLRRGDEGGDGAKCESLENRTDDGEVIEKSGERGAESLGTRGLVVMGGSM